MRRRVAIFLTQVANLLDPVDDDFGRALHSLPDARQAELLREFGERCIEEADQARERSPRPPRHPMRARRPA